MAADLAIADVFEGESSGFSDSCVFSEVIGCLLYVLDANPADSGIALRFQGSEQWFLESWTTQEVSYPQRRPQNLLCNMCREFMCI